MIALNVEEAEYSRKLIGVTTIRKREAKRQLAEEVFVPLPAS